MSAFSQWQERTYPGGSVAPEITPTQPTPFYRDGMDRLRQVGRTPEAQYPDGYLTRNPSRRDRLVDAKPTSRKPTDRGVMRDRQLQAEDYLWPDEFNPFTGLEYEARGMQFTSLAMQQAAGYAIEDYETPADPDRLAEMRRLLPKWSSGGPGMAVVSYMNGGMYGSQ